MLQFDELDKDRQAATNAIAEMTGRLQSGLSGLGEVIFQGNHSLAAIQFGRNALRIATAIQTVASEVATAVGWTAFDKSVTSLARCYATIRYRPQAFPGEAEAERQTGTWLSEEKQGKLSAAKATFSTSFNGLPLLQHGREL